MSPRRAPRPPSPRAGFTMIELVTVVAITGLLTVGLANVLRHPVSGYAAVSRRAELVALADLAVGRLTRDLRAALPNSVRVTGGGRVLELMHAPAGARYRLDPGVNDPGGPAEEDHGAPSDRLSFGGDASWNVMGRLRGLPFTHGSPLPAGTRIAIYPTSHAVWADAAGAGTTASITPAGTTIRIFDDGDEDQIRLDTDHRFPHESPGMRLFVVDTPVTYLCDAATAALWRVDGYPPTATQPADLASPPLATGSAARAADRVETCRFEYTPGTPSRSGLVTIEIALASGGERVRLLQQAQVSNAP